MQPACQTRFANILQTCESHGHKVAGPGQLRSLSGRAAGREHGGDTETTSTEIYGDIETTTEIRRFGDKEIQRYGDTATLRMRLVPLVLALMAASCWGEERLLAGPLPSLIDTIDSLGGSPLSVDSQ